MIALLSEPQEVLLSGSAQFGYFLSGIVYFLLPAAAFLMLKKYGAAKIYPVIVGAIVYFLAVRFSDLIAHFAGFTQSVGNKVVIAAELVCFLEEAGRFLAIKYPLTDIRKTSAAFCYGIGHGGLECLIRGVQSFRIVQAGALRDVPVQSLPISLLTCVHSAVIFGVQIALSLLIFYKMHKDCNEKRGLIFAILLHIFVNGAGWLASFSGSLLLRNAVGIVTGCIAIAVVCRLIDFRSCMDEILYPEIAEP